MTTTTRGAIDDPLLLAHRLGRFAGHAVVIAGAFVLLHAALTLSLAAPATQLSSLLCHLAGVAVLAVLWLATRRERRMRVLHALDMGAMVSAGVAFAAMVLLMPDHYEVGYILLLILSYGMILRAVFVPSSMARTLAVAVALAVPFAAVITFHAREPLELVSMGAWWLVSASVSAATSSVVYGLRREVHEAMRLGQYTLEEKLGEGGMGIVYRASHAYLKRPTAVKVLRPDHSGDIDIARFEREVQLSSKLTHPNTVHVFDYGRTPDGLFFYAMELIEGASLLDVVAVFGPLPPARVAHILHQVAGSLAEAHDIGLIHRDVKPSNILLCQSGGEPDVAKLVDFGMVKQLAPNDSRVLTAHNALVGTPLYMAPEAITNPSSVDQRADLYALGAVAYFLLTGSDVFEKDSIVAVCNDHLHAEPEPPSSRLGTRLPAAVEDLVMACLAKDPADRPQGARDIQRELEPFMQRHPWRREAALGWWRHYGAELSSHRGAGERGVKPRVDRSPSSEPEITHTSAEARA